MQYFGVGLSKKFGLSVPAGPIKEQTSDVHAWHKHRINIYCDIKISDVLLQTEAERTSVLLFLEHVSSSSNRVEKGT